MSTTQKAALAGGVLVVLVALLLVNLRFKLIPLHSTSYAPTQNAAPLVPLEQLSLEEKSHLSDDAWKQYLPADVYAVIRERGTEVPFTGELLNNHQPGTYVTADCGVPVFRSEQKYDSHTGWPSFWAPIEGSSIELRHDTSDGLDRVEVVEKTCNSHLGHMFDDGPQPTGKRYCMNSLALKFIPDPQ